MAFDPLASAGLTKALLDVRETVAAIASGRNGDIEDLIARRARRYGGYRRNLARVYAFQAHYGTPFWVRRCAASSSTAKDPG